MANWKAGIAFLAKYVPLWVIISAIVAYMTPDSFRSYGSIISPCLSLIMLGMGLSMTPNDFKLIFTRPKDVIIGVLTVYICMPLVGMGVGKLLGLAPMLVVGLILLGCSPTGTTSNVMTFLAKGDKALSVTVSSISTMLAPVIMPLLLLLYAGTYLAVDGTALFISIIKIVIIPVLLGLIMHKIFAKQIPTILALVPLTTIIAIILIVLVVVSLNAERLQAIAPSAALAMVLYTFRGLAIGFLVSKVLRMPKEKGKAMTFVVGVQNTALAVALAVKYFDPVAALPAAVGVVWTTVCCSFIASLWGSKTAEDEIEKPEKIEPV